MIPVAWGERGDIIMNYDTDSVSLMEYQKYTSIYLQRHARVSYKWHIINNILFPAILSQSATAAPCFLFIMSWSAYHTRITFVLTC